MANASVGPYIKPVTISTLTMWCLIKKTPELINFLKSSFFGEMRFPPDSDDIMLRLTKEVLLVKKIKMLVLHLKYNIF